MPPKSKKVVVVEPPRVPRDLLEVNPLDGRDGALGVEHIDVQARVRELQEDLVSFKASEAILEGRLDLDLKECGLEEIPEEVFDVPGLQVLDLSKNLLPNTTFENLSHLIDLRALIMTSNQLCHALPEAVGTLAPALEELVLDENVIETVPNAAAALGNLTWVSLRKNILSSFPSLVLSAWKNLVHLDLRENKLTTLPDEIGDCAYLQDLLLTGNELTALPDDLHKCTSLEVLLVNKNQLTSLPLGLGACSSLLHLDASTNKLVDIPGGVLVGLVNLQILLLGGNKITDIPPEIGACTSLDCLSLSSNALKGLPEEIGRLSLLREIYCGNNPMATLPATVTGWTQLEQGVFRNCKLKTLPAGVEEAWGGVKLLDVRAKGKKDTCKVSTDVQVVLKKTRMVGVVWTKPKKPKKKK